MTCHDGLLNSYTFVNHLDCIVLILFQKFGLFEGKTSKEFLQAIKKARRKFLDYTPPGGESIEQV